MCLRAGKRSGGARGLHLSSFINCIVYSYTYCDLLTSESPCSERWELLCAMREDRVFGGVSEKVEKDTVSRMHESDEVSYVSICKPLRHFNCHWFEVPTYIC